MLCERHFDNFSLHTIHGYMMNSRDTEALVAFLRTRVSSNTCNRTYMRDHQRSKLAVTFRYAQCGQTWTFYLS